MKEILAEIERWQEEGERVVVATVIASRRSAPRPVGSSLAISESGKLCGSVSGGCVEGDVYEQSREVLETGKPKLLSYGISDDEAWSVGLPCGGEIDVFVERLLIDRLLRAAARGWPRPSSSRSSRGSGSARSCSSSRTARRLGDGPPELAAHADELIRGARNRTLELDGLQGLRRGLRAAAAPARLRRRRHRRGALPRREAARLDDDRRRRAREVRDRRADPERGRAARRVAGRGVRAGRARPLDGGRRPHSRRQVRRARARRRRSRATPSTSARSAPGETRRRSASGCARRASADEDARADRGPVRARPRRRLRRGDGALDPGGGARGAERPQPAARCSESKQRIHVEAS